MTPGRSAVPAVGVGLEQRADALAGERLLAEARDHVQVRVHQRLAADRAAVPADVVAIRGVGRIHPGPHPRQQAERGDNLGLGQIEARRPVRHRDDDAGMPERPLEPDVLEVEYEVVPEPHVLLGFTQLAVGTGVGHGHLTSTPGAKNRRRQRKFFAFPGDRRTNLGYNLARTCRCFRVLGGVVPSSAPGSAGLTWATYAIQWLTWPASAAPSSTSSRPGTQRPGKGSGGMTGPTGCHVCGSQSLRSIHEDRGWAVYCCADCGLGAVSPPPEPAPLLEVYPEDYYAHGELDINRPSLRSDVKRLVANEYYGTRLSHRFDRLPRLAKKGLARLLGDRLRIPPPPHPGARALDVGCGNGAYLLWLRELGWDGAGNETDGGAVAVARRAGLDVFHGDLTAARFSAASFDVANFSSVLDHTADPAGNVREAFRLLAPGGWAVAHVPNFGGLQRRLFGPRWYNWIPPEHLFYFTSRAFRRLFTDAGFQIEREWILTPSNFLPHTLMYKTPARRVFEPLKVRWRVEPEWWPLVKAGGWCLGQVQNLVGEGETLYIVARKPAVARIPGAGDAVSSAA